MLATRVGFFPGQGARHTVQLLQFSAMLGRFDFSDGDGLTDVGAFNL